MIPNPVVQHRLKHFDQLLLEELSYLQRGYEQNLIIYDKLEKSIRRDSDQIKVLKRKKYSRTSKHDDASIISIERTSSVISNLQSRSPTLINEKLPTIIPKFHRHCYKAQRLPPLIKFHREKYSKTNSSINNENEPFQLLNDELPDISRTKSDKIDQRIQSFMDTLPPNQGLQKGFDNFAATALYSRRAPVLMK